MLLQGLLDLLGGAGDAPPAKTPAPARLERPRQALLAGQPVPYSLQRARRRSIGFSVGPDGLAVRAPAWVTLAEVDAALQSKADWIVRKLAEQRLRREQQEATRIAWGHGARLPYLGQPLTVLLAGRQPARASLVPAQDGAHALHLPLAQGTAPAEVRAAVQAWLMREARRRFTERLDHFAPLLGVHWTRLRLSSAATRWGSARTGGAISLNWRLMHYTPAIIDYVVAHELAHLRVMDHSPRFWSVVHSVVPNHAQLRRQLREQPAPLWE